jgi:uncharacterized protein
MSSSIKADSIRGSVDEAVKAAMRARDMQRLGVLRLIQAAFKQREIDSRVDAGGAVEITDEVALAIIEKMVKQRRDSIEQFTKANRLDLVSKEEYETGILREFLPTALSEAEVQAVIAAAIEETGSKDIKDLKVMMGVLKPRLQGRADMGEVSRLVKSMLAG